jgi:hypothetical protein
VREMNIPDNIRSSLDRYVSQHYETSGFLRAVLENNLKEAVFRADEKNILILRDIVNYIYNELPMSCWGSKEKVERWLAKKDDGKA